MLQLFRQKKEWLKWTLVLVIFLLGFTTVLLFVRTPDAGISGGVGIREVAVVAGQPITAAQFRNHYQRVFDLYRQMYNLDNADPEMVRRLGIGQMALNQLINQYAAAEEARASGLTVTDQELADRISRFPAFQEEGRFIGSDRYRQILQYSGLTPQQFEEGMRRDILSEKFRSVLTDGVQATTAEVRRQFAESNETATVEYVVFDPEEVKLGEITDEDLQAYYEENQDDYRMSERRKIRYTVVQFDPGEIEVTEDQITAALADVPEEEQVRARHILIGLQQGEEAARNEANSVLRQIKGGADFAQLAQKHSRDEASAMRGGDLGFFSRGRMVPEFETEAFSLEPGEVSDLVRTQFGYHIIQSIAKTGSDEESRRAVAEFQARLLEAENRSTTLAEEIAEAAKSGGFAEAAAARSQEVVESEYFDNAAGIPGLAVAGDFVSEIFGLGLGEMAKPYLLQGAYLLGEVADIQAERLPEFDEVRSEVFEDYREVKTEDLAKETAADFAEKAAAADSFASAARESRLEVTTTEPFKRGQNIDETLLFSPLVHEQAFAMDPGGISTPIPVANKYVVFHLAERSPFDEGKFDEEKSQLSDNLTEQKRNEFYAAYVQNVVAELRRNEQIAINQQLVDDITGL